MCTYVTISDTISGSAKGPGGRWMDVTDVTVYFDHPVHAMAEHTVNIDVSSPGSGPAARVALELTPGSARRLASAIHAALASAPAGLAGS